MIDRSAIGRLLDKLGSLGSLVGAMSCAACFPAFGALGAALGLGFLHRYEGLMLNTLLPVFAGIAAAGAALTWRRHRRPERLVAGLAGPVLVLATLYPLWSYDWSTPLFYAGVAMMVANAIWDLLSPPGRCEEQCPPRR